MGINEIVNNITKELSVLMETSGVQRAIKCVTIVQMLHLLEDTYEKEKLEMVNRIKELEEEKQNDT